MKTGIVYSTLRSQILSLKLRPGEELDLNELSSTFGLSRSPVRDAVKELSTEGLVDIYPQKGTYVSKININKADDERFMRLNLELGAIDKFMLLKSDEDIEKMKNLIKEQEKAFALRDSSALLSLDDSFHRVIFSVSKRERVFDFIQSNNGNYHRMRVISFMFDNISEGAIEQHKALINLIENDEKDELKEIDRRHISKLLIETDSFRSTMPQYFTE